LGVVKKLVVIKYTIVVQYALLRTEYVLRRPRSITSCRPHTQKLPWEITQGLIKMSIRYNSIIFIIVNEELYKYHNSDMVYQIGLQLFVCYIVTILLQQYAVTQTKIVKKQRLRLKYNVHQLVCPRKGRIEMRGKLFLLEPQNS
jgi:hypothetical protein